MKSRQKAARNLRLSLHVSAGATAGDGQCALKRGKFRLLFSFTLFALCFCAIVARLVQLSVFEAATLQAENTPQAKAAEIARPVITDRHGEVIAVNIRAAGLAAHPQILRDKAATLEQLAEALPNHDQDLLAHRLHKDLPFVWLDRRLSPAGQEAVLNLGLPGLELRPNWTRLYPHNHLFGTIVGFVDPDGNGRGGIEAYLDQRMQATQHPPAAQHHQTELRLSLDVRVQHALRQELQKSMANFHAEGAMGVVMNVRTGEILGMSSLPDFDPNRPGKGKQAWRKNKVFQNRYELGSVFKTVTVAMGLEAELITPFTRFDVAEPLRVGRFRIRDTHPHEGHYSVREILLHSSNIGAGKIAQLIGLQAQRDYLDKFRLLNRLQLAIPGAQIPDLPARRGEANLLTVSFGHGIAVPPLSLAATMAALANGGTYFPPTILRRQDAVLGRRIFHPDTSRAVLSMMRDVVAEGTGGKADVPGYQVAGKTGSAEMAANGGYERKQLLTSFIAAFPGDDPEYLVFVLLEKPQGTKATQGWRQAGWNAAPTAGHVIARIAPILGVKPRLSQDQQAAACLAAEGCDGRQGARHGAAL